MPVVTGNYSKGIKGGFDESERLAMGFVRKKIPWVDADENRKEWIRFTYMRRAFDTLIGNASPNNGFRCIGDSDDNDFEIEGGDGTPNGAGRMFVAGIGCFLADDIRYVNNGSDDYELSIYPKITFISGTGNEILQDSSANYPTNSLVGRTITPDVTQPGVTATITANTATSITVSIDLTAGGIAVGASYRVELSTPSGSDRTDIVYLNAYVDEIDGDELDSIRHDFATRITAQHFAQFQQVVLVNEDDASNPLTLNYIDADGFEHFLTPIAQIERYDGQAAIDAVDVTDLRATSGNFTNFLRKTGDNMTGDLNMQTGADINLATGGEVDGRDVSDDGTKLDTITWTSQGVADKLKHSSGPVQGLDLSAVATLTTNVSESLRAKEPGGTGSGTKGVVTTTPHNRARVVNADDDDDILGGTGGQNKVFGRVTESHPAGTLTGTWTFTTASFDISAPVGTGSATTESQVGDTVKGPNNVYYTIDTITDDDNVILKEPFAGTTGPTTAPDLRRFILTLRVNDEGTEVDYTPPSAVNIRWYYNEVFDLADKPVMDPMFSVPSDQVAAEVPDASETLKGKSQFAPNLNTDALKAVQGSDDRVNTPIQAITERFAEVEAGTSISLANVGGKLRINNTAPGGGTAPDHADEHKGGGGDEIDGATGSVAGLMSASDKTRLDNISSSAKNIGMLMGKVTHGNVIPVPIGFSESQCSWIVAPHQMWGQGGWDAQDGFLFGTGAHNTNTMKSYNYATGHSHNPSNPLEVVALHEDMGGESHINSESLSVLYLIIGVK